jgi:hypothetical protein
MPILLAFAALALSTASAAPTLAQSGGADWRVTVTTQTEEDWGKSVVFVDRASIARSGDTADFLIDIRFEKPPSRADGIRAHVRGDCARHRYELVEQAYYAADARIADGAPSAMADAQPGTSMAATLDKVCAGRVKSSSVDPVLFARTYFARFMN